MKKNLSDKLAASIAQLEHALTFRKQISKEPVYFLAITKAYEVCLEYAWKHLKARLNSDGIEAYSPKEVIKEAGRAHLLDDVESWLRFINERNLMVHDYLGISDDEYLETITTFLKTVKKLR